MKIKRLLVLAVLPMLCLAVNAQHCSKDNTPKKGDFTVAATVGYNSYTNVTAPSGLLSRSPIMCQQVLIVISTSSVFLT